MLANCNLQKNTRKSVVELVNSLVKSPNSLVKSPNSLVKSADSTADLLKSRPLVTGLELDVYQQTFTLCWVLPGFALGL